MTNLLHSSAFLQLLRANANLTVFPVPDGDEGSDQGMVPPGTLPPYAAVHLSGGPRVGRTIVRRSSMWIEYAYVHCAGETPTAAQIVADLVMATVLDVIVAIPGRDCRPIRWDSDRAPQLDKSTNPAVWSKVDVYRLESGPG